MAQLDYFFPKVLVGLGNIGLWGFFEEFALVTLQSLRLSALLSLVVTARLLNDYMLFFCWHTGNPTQTSFLGEAANLVVLRKCCLTVEAFLGGL